MQDTLMDMLDQMLELIYVVDIETYEILYINSSGQEKYGIGDQKGAKCYKLIQGFDEPCPFCSNDRLTFDSVYSWEFTNKMLGRHFLLKDRLVNWNGRKARMQIATDITERESEHRMLQNTLDAEMIVRECIGLLYEAENLSSAMDMVLERLGEYFGADRAYFFPLSGEAFVCANEWHVPKLPLNIRVQKVGLLYFHRLWSQFDRKECIVIEDMEQMQALDLELYSAFYRQKIKNIVVMPLEREGKLLGLWGVENPSAEKVCSIAPMLTSLRYFLLTTMHRVKYEALLVKLSFEDSLTGARNRNCYLQDIEEFKGDRRAGIVYISINDMKGINDTFGHTYGDKILIECAHKIEQAFKQKVYYRIGGDEFVVICRDVTKEKFEQDIRSFKKLYAVRPDCHIAIGYQWGEQTNDIQSLINAAESWMYEDKKLYYRKSLPSDRYRHYNDDVFGLGEFDVIKQRLKEGRFIVYLQPKISFTKRKVSGAEALVRYRSEEGTVIVPAQFLPVLEDARLIGQLDFFVFDFICAKLSEWSKADRQIVPISVNFSRYTLAEQDFLTQFKEVFGKYSIDKSWVVIEITESVKGVEGMNLLTLIDGIREAGFAISIDDFGVDYANLSLFTSANFDELKLDKSLVDNVVANQKTQMIIESVVDICHRMDIRVVAEGVETEEQFGILKRNGCEQAQGYLISRPVPIEEYEERFLGFR